MKSIFASRTFWVNLISLTAIIIQAITGKDILPLEAQAAIIAVINIILRTSTDTKVRWK